VKTDAHYEHVQKLTLVMAACWVMGMASSCMVKEGDNAC
jgi:hypothetical protein